MTFVRHSIPLKKGDTLVLDVNDDGALRAILRAADGTRLALTIQKQAKLSNVLEDALRGSEHRYQQVLTYVRSTRWGELLP